MTENSQKEHRLHSRRIQSKKSTEYNLKLQNIVQNSETLWRKEPSAQVYEYTMKLPYYRGRYQVRRSPQNSETLWRIYSPLSRCTP